MRGARPNSGSPSPLPLFQKHVEAGCLLADFLAQLAFLANVGAGLEAPFQGRDLLEQLNFFRHEVVALQDRVGESEVFRRFEVWFEVDRPPFAGEVIKLSRFHCLSHLLFDKLLYSHTLTLVMVLIKFVERRLLTQDRLYARTSRNHTVLGNYHYSIAYEEAIARKLLMAGFIQDLHALANASVLVDDRAANQAVWTDADARESATRVQLQFFKRLIEISPHHQHALEPRAMLDAAANPDDRVLDRRTIEYATFGYDRALYMAVEQLGPRQVTRASVHWRLSVKDVKRRQRQSHFDVGAIESADCSDVFPISIEQKRLNVVARERF